MVRRERFEVRCSVEELGRWRAACPGLVPFGAWVRGALDAAADGSGLRAAPGRTEGGGDMRSPEVASVAPVPVSRPAVSASEVVASVAAVARDAGFKPDFGKRLKP